MKQIIKHGNPPKRVVTEHTYLFKCYNCGCEFRATKNELHDSGGYTMCVCPECMRDNIWEGQYGEDISKKELA